MKFNAHVTLKSTIRDALALMASSDINNYIAGVVVCLDDFGRITGIITDGDIRRGLSKNYSLDDPVERVANFSPIVVNINLDSQGMRQSVMKQASERNSSHLKYQHILISKDDGQFHNLVSIHDLFEPQIEDRKIAVYGMGFVGLTLAASLANAGLNVLGIDTNQEVIEGLELRKPPFFENGLESLLESLAASNPIEFILAQSRDTQADIHIISVGTPVGKDNLPSFKYIEQATDSISRVIKKGDLVVLRSTLPVGTTRNLIIPILERGGLIVGVDIFVAFAPERTVEGNALVELRTLPQIIGGFDKASADLSRKLFNKITNTIVEVDSLEAAEMVKLMNNTFRDLVFSFPNEVAKICDELNINTFSLIEAANEGYPRNKIPLPSPGVGGACLAKDPYLYTYPYNGLVKYKPLLGNASRQINSIGHMDVIEKLMRFCSYHGKELQNIKIFIVGIAFKGAPETSDIRESMALKLIEQLPDRKNIFVKDFVVSRNDMALLEVSMVDDILEGFDRTDAVLFMNNHPSNSRFNLLNATERMNKPSLWFDGWNLFNQRQIESMQGVRYSTLGYMTPYTKNAKIL